MTQLSGWQSPALPVSPSLYFEIIWIRKTACLFHFNVKTSLVKWRVCSTRFDNRRLNQTDSKYQQSNKMKGMKSKSRLTTHYLIIEMPIKLAVCLYTTKSVRKSATSFRVIESYLVESAFNQGDLETWFTSYSQIARIDHKQWKDAICSFNNLIRVFNLRNFIDNKWNSLIVNWNWSNNL